MARRLVMIVLCLCCIVSPLILLGAFQLQRIQGVAKPVPSQLALADLLETGPTNNAHLELTYVYFGKPIVEEDAGEWLEVWLPLYVSPPHPEKPEPPVIVYRTSQLSDPAAVAEFVERAMVTGLLLERIPAPNPWEATLPAGFAKAFPKADAAKVKVLVNPDLRISSWVWGPEVVLNPDTLIWAWSLGGALLLVGAAGLLLLGRSDQRAAVPPPVADGGELKARLAREPAVSTHAFASAFYYGRKLKGGLLLCFIGLLAVFLLCIGFSFLDRDPKTSLMVMGVGVIMLAMAWLIWVQFGQVKSKGVAELEICASGIRWRRTSGSPVETALWSELHAHRKAFPILMGLASARKDEVTVRIRSGQELVFSRFNLTDYPVFAQLITASHKPSPASTVNHSISSYQPSAQGAFRRW